MKAKNSTKRIQIGTIEFPSCECGWDLTRTYYLTKDRRCKEMAVCKRCGNSYTWKNGDWSKK